LAFQARGGPEPAPGVPDPKGYHHAEVYFALGNCYLLQENYQQAALSFEHAVSKDATHTYAWLNQAKAHYELGQYAEAAISFGHAYAADEIKNPEYLYYSAAAYLMAGDHLQSIDRFEELLATHPEAIRLEWKEHLVHAYLATDQPRRALPFIRELARRHSGDKQIQWQEILLYQYLHLNMPSEALSLAKALSRQAPTVATWWKALTHIHLDAGNNDKALAAFTIYAYLAPLSLSEKKLLADLNLQAGIPVKAAPVYEACLGEKKDKNLLLRLVTAYRQLDRCETALKRMDAFGHEPHDAQWFMTKGELLFALKKFDQAAVAFRQAAQADEPRAGRAWLMAGYAAWQMDDISASTTDFKRAAAHKGQKKIALAALRQLNATAGK
jgi:tetratricopeptide (TPR) repeat protein